MKDTIKKWNVWWENPSYLDKLIGIEREFLAEMTESFKAKHIKDIIGVRRCGKTVLMYQLMHALVKNGVDAQNVLYLNFDDPELSNLSEAIKNALQLRPTITHVFLDEIQNIKEWEKIIRVYYDMQKFGQIFVSGSSASLISRDVGKRLTGRHMTRIVTPFSFREFLKYHGVERPDQISERERVIHLLEAYLENGGFPETLGKEALISRAMLVDLYNDILSRDITSRFGAELDAVKKIGYYLMTNVGSPFSYNSIAMALTLHYETVKKYVPYFEEVFLIFIVPHFSWKIKVQLKKDMKCYSVDTGLRNAVSFRFSDDMGRLAEGAVAAELKRRGVAPYFWKSKREVDFVVMGDELTAMNVTYTDNVHKREREGLLEFREKHGNAKLVIITKEMEQIDGDGIEYVPLWKWLLG